MSTTRLSDQVIVRTAVVITAVDANTPAHLQHLALALMLLRAVISRTGQQIFLVYWPTGPASLMVGDPSDKAAWDRLLIDSYRQAEAGVMGPLQKGGLDTAKYQVAAAKERKS